MDFTLLLKRLFLLIILALAFILMVFYFAESQSFIASPYLKKSKGSALARAVDSTSEPPHKSGARKTLQESWTYICENDKCVRKFYSNKHDKRITLSTCEMTCGKVLSKIWPMPEKTRIEKSVTNFEINRVRYKIESPFENVVNLLEKAVKLFLEDIKNINGSAEEENEIEEKSTTIARENGAIGSILIDIEVKESSEVLMTLETNECYKLVITNDNDNVSAKISGKTFYGARHGLETLQQLIWYDDAINSMRILNSVKIEDCPKFNYRGIMLDTSRHYFSLEAIKRTITGMSHVKLNRFHWHMTDSQSFPFVSKNYPEMSEYGAYSASEVYTHEDVREIVEYARVRGVQVNVEIDVPAHSGNGWQWGERNGMGNLSLCVNQQPWEQYCGQPSCGQLNPKNKNTYKVLRKLYKELLEITDVTDFFHMGGDEVNFNCWKQHFRTEDPQALWCDFMSEAHDLLISANDKKPINAVTVWNSDLQKMSCLKPENFTIQIWLSSLPEMVTLLSNKYKLIISHVDAWYLDCGFGSWRGTIGTGTCPPFKSWYTVYNYRPWTDIPRNFLKQILGGEACMWTEQVDENSLDTRLWPRSIAFAERLWSDPPSSYIPPETFNRFSLFHTRFLQLGLKSDAIFPKYCEQNPYECVRK